MENQVTVIEGLEVKEFPGGDCRIRFHVKDLIACLQQIKTLDNGTVIAFARKRSKPSPTGHTHWKPEIRMERCEPSAA